MWLLYPERIGYWYEKIRRVLEGDVPIFRVDGTNPVEKVTSDVKKHLEQLY